MMEGGVMRCLSAQIFFKNAPHVFALQIIARIILLIIIIYFFTEELKMVYIVFLLPIFFHSNLTFSWVGLIDSD